MKKLGLALFFLTLGQANLCHSAGRIFSTKALQRCQTILNAAKSINTKRAYLLPKPGKKSLAGRNPEIGKAILDEFLSLSKLYENYEKLNLKPIKEADLSDFEIQRLDKLSKINTLIESSNLNPEQRKVFTDAIEIRKKALNVRIADLREHMKDYNHEAVFSDLAAIDVLFRSKLAEIVMATRLGGVVAIGKKYTDLLPASVLPNLGLFEFDIARIKPDGIYEFIDVKDNLPYPSFFSKETADTKMYAEHEPGELETPNEFIHIPDRLSKHLPAQMRRFKPKLQLMRHGKIIERANHQLRSSPEAFPPGARSFELGYLFLVNPRDFSPRVMERNTPVDHVYTLFQEQKLEKYGK